MGTAASCGGGISTKSAQVQLAGALVTGNQARGLSTSGWGNGGGLYVTTCWYEGGGVAAALYLDDGTLSCSGAGALLQQNTANRFGGGIYIGIYDPGLPGGSARLDAARVDLTMQNVVSNTAFGRISDAGYLASPSQIATENVQACAPPRVAGPTLGFNVTLIQGALPLIDIGIYQTNSVPITGGPAYVLPTLYKPIIPP